MRFQDLWVHFFRSWSRKTKLQISTLAVLSGVFTLIAFTFLFYENLNEFLKSLGQSFEMNVYLDSSVSKKKTLEIQKILESNEEVKRIKWISKEEALKSFLLQIPEETKELLLNPKDNPLPGHFQVTFKKLSSHSKQEEKRKKWHKEWSALPGVESVSYSQFILQKYTSFLKSLYPCLFLLIFFLLIGSLFILGNLIRGSLSQSKDEMTILKSMGSTVFMISGPFVFEGIVMNLMATCFSLCFTYILFFFQTSFFESLFDFLPFGFQMKYLSVFFILSMIFLSVLFGALGSYFCVQEVYEEKEEMVEWEKEWQEA